MSKDRMQDGKYEKSVLDNGMHVVTEHLPYVRSVAVGFCIIGGSRIEPSPLNGITHFIEHMLFKGTKKRTAKDIAIEIDSTGGHLDAFTSRELTCFFASSLDENLPQIMDLLVDILLNPSFPEIELERERFVISEEIRSIEDSPDEYVHDMLLGRFWGDHPLGRPIIGEQSKINSIVRENLMEYYRKTYQPQNIILTAAGHVHHGQILEMVADKIPVPEGPFINPAQPLPSISHNITLKEKDLEQVHICLGTAGLSHTDESRYAGYLLNTILGGGMSSRLFQSIREERGLAYTVYSGWSPFKDTGMLLVYSSTKKENAEEVLDIMLKEFRGMKKDYVVDEEMTRAKNQVKTHIMLGLESTANRMSRLAKQEIYFERLFNINEILNAIDRVTKEEILELANRVLNTQFLNLSSLGPLTGLDFGENTLVC